MLGYQVEIGRCGLSDSFCHRSSRIEEWIPNPPKGDLRQVWKGRNKKAGCPTACGGILSQFKLTRKSLQNTPLAKCRGAMTLAG